MKETDRSEDIKLDEKDVYGDITNEPYLKSIKFRHMPRGMRAAQFAPFAALSGHLDVMGETARVTSEQKELDVQKKEEINCGLTLAKERLRRGEKVFARVIFFRRDARKNGGEYIETAGKIDRIDEGKNHIIFVGNNVVSIPDITEFEI